MPSGRLSSMRIDCDPRLLSPDGLCPGESLRSWPGRQLQPRPHLAQASECDAATGSAGRHPRTLPVQTRTQISQFCIARASPPKEGGLARYSSQPSNERDELNHALLRNAPAVRCRRRNWRRRNDSPRRRRQKSCHLNIEPDGVVPWRVKVQRKVRHIYKFLNRLPGHTNPSSNVGIELSISS